MTVCITGNDKLLIPNRRLIKSWINRTIKAEGKKAGELSIIFTTDEFLLDLNKKYLKHNYYTDVITFDYSEENIISGDIFVSLERVAENASIYGEDLRKELLRVIIHGVLHLCGYGDKTPDEKDNMRNKEDLYLFFGAERFNLIEDGFRKNL